MHVTKTVHVRLPGGRSIVMREGPREVVHDPEGNAFDRAAELKKALGEKVFKELVRDGVIEE